jgi:hypothetical protein
MMKTRAIPFSEFRHFLKKLGYEAKRSDAAWIFHHPTEDLLAFRLYGETEVVDERDLRIARKFLDQWGLIDEKDFDAFVQQSSTPA